MNNAPILRAVRHCLMQAGLWNKEAVLLAAVSGGADSVALLFALWRLQHEMNYTLRVCHVQHGLRGEASVEDEDFVRTLCQKLNVPLSVLHAGLNGSMEEPGMETQARNCRRALFEKQMKTLHANALLLAHHRDDQAETVLMHLLRGAGMQGLCGMQAQIPFAGGLMLRPFLGFAKQELLDVLTAESLQHREDESNQSALTPRNALRLTWLPQVEKLFPQAGKHIAQAAQVLAVDEACLEAQAAELYDHALLGHMPLFSLHKAVLLSAHDALVRRVLRHWFLQGLAQIACTSDEHSLCQSDTRALLSLLHAPSGTTLNLPCSLQAVAGTRYLHLKMQGGGVLQGVALSQPAPTSPLPLNPSVQRYELSGVVLHLVPCIENEPTPVDARSVLLTAQWLAQSPVLRTPMPTDQIQPFGASGSKPLRRHLTDRKIDPAFRPLLPVLAVDSHILWIPALTSAEELRVPSCQSGCYRLWVEGDIPYLP